MQIRRFIDGWNNEPAFISMLKNLTCTEFFKCSPQTLDIFEKRISGFPRIPGRSRPRQPHLYAMASTMFKQLHVLIGTSGFKCYIICSIARFTAK